MNTRIAGSTLFAVGMWLSMSSHAVTLFSDNFDSDATNSALNFTNLINWTVSDGTIDYIRNGGFGLQCYGNAGGCLDMDGSTSNAGRITSKQTFTLSPGVTYTFTGQVSGSQRSGSPSDSIRFGFWDVGTGSSLVSSLYKDISALPLIEWVV